MRDGWYGSNRFVCTTLNPGRLHNGFIHHDKHYRDPRDFRGLKNIVARVWTILVNENVR